MTRDEIIKLASQAIDDTRSAVSLPIPFVLRLAVLVAAAERAKRERQEPVRLTDRDKDDLAAPYSGMGGIEDYRAYAQDIETAALRANGFDIQPARGGD